MRQFKIDRLIVGCIMHYYMGRLAERMIVQEVQEKSRIKQERITLRNKIAQEKIHEDSISALRLFSSYRNIDKEWFWNFIAYTYFICKTLGLLILIDLFIFNKPIAILFIFTCLSCYYLNLKLYKAYFRKKDQRRYL